MKTTNNILFKCFMLLILAVGWGGNAWAQDTKTITLSFSNISETTATVNVSGTGADGVTATVGRARQNGTTEKNYFISGAGFSDHVLGVNYDNRQNDFWEVPITINGLSAANAYTLTTNMRLLNSAGNYQSNGTSRAWIETIYVNGIQHATTGDLAFIRGNANENQTFNSFEGSSPLVLTIRMHRMDPNGCFAGIQSLTLTYAASNDYLVKIKGDSAEGYTVTAGDATAKNGQRLDPAKVPTGTDLRSVRIDAPANKHVWGPVIDHTAKTITFEVSDPVAPQTGKWYKVQVLPTNGVLTTTITADMVTTLNDNIKAEGVRSNYMYLQNAPQPSRRSNYQSIHNFQGMPEKEAAGYIRVTSFNGNIMFQHINGRYISNDGKQQTGVNNSSDVQLTLTNQGAYTNCYSWKHLRPWVLDGNDVAPYVGRASNTTNNFFTYFAEVDPTEKYDVYQVTVQGGNTGTTINYVGDASASEGFNSIYNGGYFFFRKGYVPQSADFTTNVSFATQAIEIVGNTGIRQLLIKDNDSFSVFSPAPSDGQWAPGTKWYTIRNHRKQNYISTDNNSLDDSYQIKWNNSTARPTAAEGLWCFVEDGANGFRIYNKAYGPDFALQMTGRNTNDHLVMAHLSEINAENSHFHFAPNTNTYSGSPEFCIIQGASGGGVGINSIGGNYPGVWAAQESNHSGDQGSAFFIQRVEESVVNATTAYTAYKVVVQPEGLSVKVPVTFEYSPASVLGAKTAHHSSGNYILIRQGVTPSVSNFTSTVVPEGFTGYALTQSTTSPRYNIITLTGKVNLPHVIHRPNGNLWRAKHNSYDGTSTNTVGTQTDDYTEVELENGETVKLQHTGVFEITHFLAPGETRQIWMPATSSSNSGQPARILNYMRWFDYKNESLPDLDIVNLAADQVGDLKSRAWYYVNGVVVGSSVNGVYPNRYVEFNMPSSLTQSDLDYEYTLANEATRYNDFCNNFTSGTAATGNASYLGTFTDPNGTATGNQNLIEPTIGTRQIYHIRSAHEMATKLSACTGSKWLEEETITFPTRGVNWSGYEDVIPLEYNFLDYWAYNGSGVLCNVRNAQTTIKAEVQANAAGISIVSRNCNDYLAGSQVFAEANNNTSRDAGHYISFAYPAGGIITVPDGMTSVEATICVYLDINGTRYNIKKFNLVFQNNLEAVPYYEVLGDVDHPRSDKSLAAMFGNSENPSGVYTQLNFHYEHNYLMGTPGSSLSEGRGYYAFPYNFDEVSYSYFANGMAWCDWGEYGMRNNGATATHHSSINFQPDFLSVNYLRELYKKKNAEAEYAAGQSALAAAHNASHFTPEEKAVAIAEAEYRINEANKILADVTPEKLQEAWNNNYYIYVDASEQPGQVGRLRINEPLCTGTRIYGTAWLSASSAYTAASPDPASVIFRFKGVKNVGGKEEFTTIYSYCPGQISNIGRDKNRQEVYFHQEQRYDGANYNEAIWQQVAFSFVNPYPATEFDGFVLEIFNNCRGSSGGDIFLDDIRLYIKTPQVNVDNAAPICGDELSIVRISTDFDALMDALQGAHHVGDPMTYYGTYAILDKEVYDSYLAAIPSPTTTDVAEAFNRAIMGETDKANCYIGGDFFPELYAFHDIKFYSDYLSHQHVTYSMLVGDNILDTAGYMYQYSSAGEIISRNLVFNCKITDERIAGKKYYLVFKANVVPHDMTTIAKAEYAEFFSMGDICCVRSEFETMRAKMVRIEGEDELDPYGIDYCPGTAPTISLNSYGYDYNGEIIQEHGVFYDWYFGTLQDFHKERVWIDGADIDVENLDSYSHRDILTAEDFCMEHCLLNFRYFYPNAGVDQLYDGTVRVHHFEKDSATDSEYELTEKMIAKLKEWVESGKLRLHLTAVSVDLSKYAVDNFVNVLAIQQGAKLRYEHDDTEKLRPILYCMDPVQISFHVNLEAPGASVGLPGVDYSMTPYNRDVVGKNVYYSVPLRICNPQISAVRSGKKLEVPIRVIQPSGYYKVDEGGVPVNTNKIHLDIDDADNDIYVAETNDPQWQLRRIDGTGAEYLPSVGKLLSIDADKDRHDGYDLMVIQFNDATHDNQEPFVPREGYYYLLRTQFTENLNDGVVLSPAYDVPDVKCKGNIIIPLKIVPEYMKWTGRESDDWNNDRNWIRADYRELVPSDAQNHAQDYLDYPTNTSSSVAYTRDNGYNGLPDSANDDIADDAKKDMYIPMDQPSVSSLYNTFAYAPMVETSVIIPSGLERYPVVSAHPKTAENLVRLTEVGDGTNTPWIAYDMVTERKADGNYSSERYYENRIKDITFQPATMMYDAQNLTYAKAWVEYALGTNRWYTIGSALQETYSGEWYSPTASGAEAGRQLSPLFRGINYNTSLNNRFNPAYYQRSWDQGTADMYRCYDASHSPEEFYLTAQNPLNVAVALDWSNVYNDVDVDYSNGGFSVKPVLGNGADGEVLVRMPKEDAAYFYFDKGNEESPLTHRGDETTVSRTAAHYRLFSDKLATAFDFTQSITNAGGASNPYYLVANPLMAPLDMDEFFAANTQFEAGKFWIMQNDLQGVTVKTTEGWLSTTGANAEGAVAPLQAFFVKMATPAAGPVSVTYTAAMQKVLAPADAPVLKAPAKSRAADAGSAAFGHEQKTSHDDGLLHIEAMTADGVLQSQTTVLFSDEAANAYAPAEDAELLLDGNTADHVATVFTVAPSMGAEEAQALQFNALSRTVATIPFGVIAPEEDTETRLTFTGITALAEVMEDAPYLYDAANGSFTALEEGQQLTVSGTTSGRYFIVSGMNLPFASEAAADATEEPSEVYNLHGIRVATPQHGTVLLRGSRKEFNR